MDPLLRLRDESGVKLLEDAAEVLGAEYYSEYSGGRWIKCGAMGDAAATSFYANKLITTGEGGMVVTDDPNVAERASSYRNLCFQEDLRFVHTELGYNFRLTNLQAAVGVAQLERIDHFIRHKIKCGEYYRSRFEDVEGLRFMPIRPSARSVYWMYAIELDSGRGVTASAMREHLASCGIGSRPFFYGLHSQPAFHSLGLFEGDSCPVADNAYKYGLYLPSGMTLTLSQVDEVVDAVSDGLEHLLGS
jgi:perosamine synthetase